MYASYNKTVVSLIQMKRLLWRHTIGLVHHLPALGEWYIGIAPLVEGGVGIAFTQNLSCLVHRYASFLCSHAIIKIAFAVRKVIIQIAQDMISLLRYQYNVTIKVINLHQSTIRGRNLTIFQSTTISYF